MQSPAGRSGRLGKRLKCPRAASPAKLHANLPVRCVAELRSGMNAAFLLVCFGFTASAPVFRGESTSTTVTFSFR